MSAKMIEAKKLITQYGPNRPWEISGYPMTREEAEELVLHAASVGCSEAAWIAEDSGYRIENRL